MNKLRHASLAGAAITVMVLTAACGGSGSSAKDDYGKAPAGSSSKIGDGYGAGPAGSYGSGGAGDSSQTQAKNAPAKEMTVREAPGIGSVVADSAGMTLYRFDKDTAQPPASLCDGDCAKAWPPVPAGDATAASGIGAAVGEVRRSDGTKQLTLAGWPVYRYAKDTAPGDTKGQGVGGTWSAFAPDGKKAGGGKGGAQEGKPDAKPGTTPETKPEPKPDAQAPAGVSVSDNPALGKIVVDGQGRTLYRFDKDSAWPMKFACTGTCLDTWKPAGPVDKSAVRGVPEKLISTVTRPDGTKQLAVDCWPVYWFTGDKKPGDTAGQGKQGLWFAVNDQGKKVTSAPQS
ncbi:SCO0930 family lipoprotein [Streptomyces sp. URMC 127]|uniref:SCO0930 family lipoprotein n=1 Tax=Streptomyces sp. URMC 127 TaxID=3423402 RepID=UPI003F19D3F6